MNIVIAGCGKVGSAVTEALAAEGHNVIAIDSDPAVAGETGSTYDVMTVCGSCSFGNVLEEAKTGKSDLYIAMTDSDELNMLSCFFAKKMGAKHTIARIRDTDYDEKSLAFMQRELGLSMSVNPEKLAATELYNILKLPSAAMVETFSTNSIEMIEITLKNGSLLDGVRLCEIRGRLKENFLVVAVQRGSLVYIPNGSFELKGGDQIGLVADPDELHKLLKTLGMAKKESKNIMVLGGSRTAFFLTEKLLKDGSSVKILEQNPERCASIAEFLPGASVVHADGARQEILMEEGLPDADGFAALTGIDEENILASYFAASKGVAKVVSKVNRSELCSIAAGMGIESVVSPKTLVTEKIIRYARALKNTGDTKMETLYKIMDSNAEAIEFKTGADFPACGVALKDMKLEKGIIIAGIVRGRQTIIPSGSDAILEGDSVIVISADKKIGTLADILS